ncbi:hypothetical protein TIFTF001_031622 [Ficus carica]|uniref:Uncharacterized protein n=1 Tax=Ficus carica TaxID=3494 RepID=A0AA88DVP8_FICCA|nr:hypothetical protein TIFTF001_031622 [Ficus carica]
MVLVGLDWLPEPLHVKRFGSWFKLDWTGRPNHSMAIHHGKQPTDNA